jgi:hypothetical protein
MKYLLLLNRTEDALPEPGTPAAQAMLREYTAAVQAMAEAGVLVDCAPLTATSAATTVRVRDEQVLPGHGPDVDQAISLKALRAVARKAVSQAG